MVHRELRKGRFADRVGTFSSLIFFSHFSGIGAPIYLAASLEYICAEILELAGTSFLLFFDAVHYLGNAALDDQKTRIVPRHLMLAFRNDQELNRLMGSVSLDSASAIPSIHAVMQPQNPSESSQSASPASGFSFGSGPAPSQNSNKTSAFSFGDNLPAGSSGSSGFSFVPPSTDVSDPDLDNMFQEIREVLGASFTFPGSFFVTKG